MQVVECSQQVVDGNLHLSHSEHPLGHAGNWDEADSTTVPLSEGDATANIVAIMTVGNRDGCQVGHAEQLNKCRVTGC